MTKVYKVTLMIVDHDEVGADEIPVVLENARFPNRCINPQVVSITSAEVEWDDAHPLNQCDGWKAAFHILMGDP